MPGPPTPISGCVLTQLDVQAQGQNPRRYYPAGPNDLLTLTLDADPAIPAVGVVGSQSLVLVVELSRRPVLSARLTDLLSPPHVRAETVRVDRQRQKLQVNVASQGHTIVVHFAESRDFKMVVCTLEKVGFPINPDGDRSAILTSLHNGVLPPEFTGDTGPRLSSITPLARLPSLYEFGKPPVSNPEVQMGDLSFSGPSNALNGYTVPISGHTSQGNFLSSSQEATSSAFPSPTNWASSPTLPLNPCHVFGSRHGFENYVPRVGSPLRIALPARAPPREDPPQQFHTDQLSRRASFNIGPPSERHCDESSDRVQRPFSSSQPAAQPSHYFPSGNSPISSQGTELSNQSIETDTTFRDGLPQPRNLPFRQKSGTSAKKSSSSKSTKEKPRLSAQTESSSGPLTVSHNKVNRIVNNGEKQINARTSAGAVSEQPSKKRRLKSPQSTAENKQVTKHISKKAKTARVNQSRAASEKPRCKLEVNLTASSPKRVRQVKKPSAPGTVAKLKDSPALSEDYEKASPMKPSICPGTSRAASYSDHDDNAIPTSTGALERPKTRYPCLYHQSHGCEKAFTTSYKALRHSQIHTAERPFQCPYSSCQKKFTRGGHLKRHLKTHFNDKSQSSGGSLPNKSSAPESHGSGETKTVLPSVVAITQDSQRSPPANRRLAREALRDVGMTAEQLGHVEMEETSSQRFVEPGSSSSLPADNTGKTNQTCCKVNAKHTMTLRSSHMLKQTSIERATGSKRSSSRKPAVSFESLSSPATPDDRQADEPKDQGATNAGQARTQSRGFSDNTLAETGHEPTSQTVSPPDVQPGTLPSNAPDLKESPQYSALDKAFAALDPEPVVLVADAMLKEVNKMTSVLLDQFVADVARGCNEEDCARFYLERLHTARRDRWHALLLEQGV